MNNSMETFTDKIKQQQEQQAQELLKHTGETLKPLKADITRLYGDVVNSINENTANIRRLLNKNLIIKWWIYPLVMMVTALIIVLPGMWVAGNLIAKHMEIKITDQLTEIQMNEESLETMKSWGIVPKVIKDTGLRYLLLPKGSPKPELRKNDAGYQFVILGVYEETKEE